MGSFPEGTMIPQKPVNLSIQAGQAYTGDLKIAVSPADAQVALSYDPAEASYTIQVAPYEPTPAFTTVSIHSKILPDTSPRPIVRVQGHGRATFAVGGHMLFDARGAGRTPENTRVVPKLNSGVIVYSPKRIP